MRIFVVGNCDFPRGGAVANYLQYLCLSLIEGGNEVYLLSRINKEFLDSSESKIVYRDINLLPLYFSPNRLIKHYQGKTGMAQQKTRKLNQASINCNDIVYVLSNNRFLIEALLRMRDRIGFKLCCGVLELFPESFYGDKRGYKSYYYAINNLIPQCDLVMPISTYLDDFYRRKGCKTFIVPPLSEYLEAGDKPHDIINFILPAQGRMKDSLSVTLRSFLLLDSSRLRKIKLHLCGISEETINLILNEKERNTLKDVICLHSWMKYDELERLYNQCHFLILLRDQNQVTLANFPSKVTETMRYGVVPIVSDVGDYTRYYLRDGVDSIFVSQPTEYVASKAIRSAIDMDWTTYDEYSNNARNCIKQLLDYRIWASRFNEALR